MGLFGKKKTAQDEVKNNVVEVVEQDETIEQPKIRPMEIIRDVQCHLQISTKLEIPTLPSSISISRIPNPESFKLSLQSEVDAPDVDEKKIAEEKAKLEAEQKAAEEKAIIEAEEQAKLEAEQKAAEEQARIEAEQKAKLEAEQKAAEEQVRIEAEEQAKLEAEEQAKLEAEQKAAEEQARIEAEQKAAEEKARIEAETKKQATVIPTPTISIISGLGAKIPKGRKPVKLSAVKAGGVAAAKAEEERLKELEEEKKRQEFARRVAEQKEAERKAEQARLANVILINDATKPEPSLGKYEIQYSNNIEKPYKLVLKTDSGKIIFETAPIRTKPNELTARMFKDIMEQGSFNFIKTPTGFAFRILDSRKRLFCVSKMYKYALDAQKAAAIIKKFGLSANYIDDTTI